ncbi:TrmB family transcriptional regulator [Halosimplex carlsbadense 2-9-1]|uniref:TrmB family transcriptional regulator n=1 Tax=Halosimplex carlsbadense 2-9-1 TaxID=797114 RepID=M0CZY1_9EURY|nr:TrmB family transcriptional regulator [Halosimplex carlsbadense]ELZ28806.1 TrmB family transcriptional regulator [Halosimplex carlsbadense 2-9-1]
MSESRIREHLGAFGLSTTEVATYLAILRRGEATTGDVAAAADVSQGYVYDVAETLVDRGLVTVDESANPTVLRARSATEAVAELSTRVSDLQSAIGDVYSEPTTADVGFEVIRSRRTVERRAERFLDDATHEAFVVVPATAFGTLKEAMADAVERGVFVYCVLLAPDTEVVADAVADFDRYAHVARTWEARPQVFVLRDARAGLVGSHGVLTGRHGDEYAVAFGQPEVANGFYGNMVSNVWPMGEPRHVADPPELPGTFEYFRNGVTTAAQHLDAGRDIVADVTVADTGTDHQMDFESVPVREANQTLVPPVTSSFPVESALVVETDGGPVSVGGDSPGFDPYFEEFAAREITLREA